MVYRCLISILLVAALAACETNRRNKPAAGSAAAPAPAETTMASKTPDYLADSGVPPMERDRKINEQDCRTGIDLLAGNLRCK